MQSTRDHSPVIKCFATRQIWVSELFMQERTKSIISHSCMSGWEGIKRSNLFSCPRKMKSYSSTAGFCALHKLQAAPCTQHLGKGRQRDAFAVLKRYSLQRTPLPTGFCWCKTGNLVDDQAC